MHRKKGLLLERKEFYQWRKNTVECILEKVRKPYPSEYCKEIMPGVCSKATSHM